MDDSDHTDDGYTGEVTVQVGDVEATCMVTLTGHFEPVDGLYHWYGRLSQNDALSEVVGAGKADAEITTPHGTAAALLSDVDPWGRLRVSGTSTPPYPLLTLEEIESAKSDRP